MNNIIHSLTKTLTEMGTGVVQTIKDSRITESIGHGVQTVKETIMDPKLQEGIRESVQTGKNKMIMIMRNDW